jgi:hypothetical protein
VIIPLPLPCESLPGPKSLKRIAAVPTTATIAATITGIKPRRSFLWACICLSGQSVASSALVLVCRWPDPIYRRHEFSVTTPPRIEQREATSVGGLFIGPSLKANPEAMGQSGSNSGPLIQSRGWSSSVEGCSCNEQMSPPPKSSSGRGCVRRLDGRRFLFYAFEHDVFSCAIVKLKEVAGINSAFFGQHTVIWRTVAGRFSAPKAHSPSILARRPGRI